jgi:hypothetical protein
MAFTPPPASKSLVDRIDFGAANPVAQDRKAAFDADDARPENRDPSRCKALLRFANGTIFWSSKMAIDADGPAAGPGRLRGSQLDPSNSEGQDTTNYRFPEGGPMLASEVVPYVVLPGGTFRDQTGLAFGDVVMVIFGNKMAGALSGDLGPANKIGEGSIRLHELLHPPAPDPCARRDANGFCQRIRNASIGEDVLFFAFPGSAFTSGINQSNAERLAGERAAQLFAAVKTPER